MRDVGNFELPFLTRGVTREFMSIFIEQRVLEGLRKLDSPSIGAIYDQYFSEIYRFIRYRIADDGIAEDLASDVFVRLLEAAQRNQGPRTSLKGWLIATASNSVNDYLRKKYRRPVEELSESMPDEQMSVHAQVDLREDHQMIRNAYATLTNEQQDVLALRFGQGYSLEETATHMKKNVNAIKALQFRALASLQRQIGEMSHE